MRVAQDDTDRMRIWKGRKSAFSAVGRLSPEYIVQDGVVPRGRLAQTLAEIQRLGAEYGIRVANVFHAGDGNLHPLILIDGAAPEHWSGPSSLPVKSWSCAFVLAGRSLVSTALEWRSATTCR